MGADQIWSHEVTFHPEDVQDRSKCHNPDYRVYLPDKIKKLKIESGTDVIIERQDQNKPHFLVGKRLTEADADTVDSDSVYQIFTDGSNRLRVTLSADWVDEFIEYDGDDIMVVEVNENEKGFRIYKNDDYNDRLQELNDQDVDPRFGLPVVLGLPMFYETRYWENTSSIRDGFGDDIDDEPPATASE
jgi:hypothetical protein